MLLAWVGVLAWGSPYEELIPVPLEAVDPDRVDEWLEAASGRAPAGTTSVQLVGLSSEGERIPVVQALPPLAPVPEKQPGYRSFPVQHPGSPAGFLAGKATYLSQCHGWIWSESLDRFATQRGTHYDTVEDFHNPEAMNQVLAAYLENAGADVFMVKERDHNPLWALSDNDGEGYEEVGTGFRDGARGFGLQTTYDYGDNPFDAGSSREFPGDGGGQARWTPTVPEDGYYNVYVAWQSGADRHPAAHYRVLHNGGVIDRWFDQRVHGSNWRFIANLWLEAGTESLAVELLGDSSEPGLLSADVVRVGGGVGLVRRHGLTTGRPRWEEGAILATQFNGAPASVYDPFGDGDGSDPSSRSAWADWEHPTGEDAIYLSWHSNATSAGSARGTVTYHAGNRCAVPAVSGSSELADRVQRELVDQFDPHWEPDWRDRGVRTACFSEVNPSRNNEMPAALVELAFHDNETDTWYLRHPRFRMHAARGMYRGIVRYFAERDGVAPTYLPEPPVALAAVQSADGIAVSWAPGEVGPPNGDVPTHYRVFTSVDGRSWDNGTDVDGLRVELPVQEGELIWVRVAAVNAGGVSFPSSVVGARRSVGGRAPVLIVDAFDRVDAGQLHTVSPGGSLGAVVRMNLRQINSFDTAVAYGIAVDALGWPFDAVSDEALPDLSGYQLVIWATGEESTADETFSTEQQAAMREFVEAGGALWATGAEILWDLQQRDQEDFALDVLGATLERDVAGSTDVDGVGLLAGIGPLDFALEDGAPYPVEYPDTLLTEGEVLARYTSGEIAAARSGNVVHFGFPVDAIGDPSVRAEVTARLLPALLPNYDPTLATQGDSDGFGDGRRQLLEGCGCATPGPSGLWLGALVLPLLGLRRPRGGAR